MNHGYIAVTRKGDPAVLARIPYRAEVPSREFVKQIPGLQNEDEFYLVSEDGQKIIPDNRSRYFHFKQPGNYEIRFKTHHIYIKQDHDIKSLHERTSGKHPRAVVQPTEAAVSPQKETQNEVTTLLSKFGDYRPLPEKQYFTISRAGKERCSTNKRLAAIIPFFNEAGDELCTTLCGLHDQVQTMKQEGLEMSFYALIVMDGWMKASISMKEYIEQMFPPGVSDDNEEAHYRTYLNLKDLQGDTETLVLERKRSLTDECVPVVVNPTGVAKKGEQPMLMNVVCIIKRDNRRKHNSHEWFFGKRGFAEYIQADYLLATDAFTTFEDKCIFYLVRHIHGDSFCSAVTGRQRVMSRYQQGSSEDLVSCGSWYRCAQCYDYEASFACYTGAFALLGFLPVIPGPCGVYSAKHLLDLDDKGVPHGDQRETPADWYFKVVNNNPDETGMVLGNLRIAEDRILSYAAVLKTRERCVMALVPDAIFYFEAELQLKQLMLQRRRWINGTVAGYMYLLLQNFGLLLQARMHPLRKIAVSILLWCQLIVYCVVAVSPAIFLINLRYTLSYMFEGGVEAFGGSLLDVVWLMAVALYVVHATIHTSRPFELWVFTLLLILGMLIIGGALFSVSLYFYEHGGRPDVNRIYNDFPRVQSTDLPIFAAVVMSLPIILGCLVSFKSVGLMLLTFFPFYFFVPMLVAWFGAYSFGRTWDLTWGNRPAGEEKGQDQGKQAETQRRFKEQASAVAAVIICANILIILVLTFLLTNTYVIMALLLFVFGFALLQMIMSALFFIKVLIFHRLCCCFRSNHRYEHDNLGAPARHLDIESQPNQPDLTSIQSETSPLIGDMNARKHR